MVQRQIKRHTNNMRQNVHETTQLYGGKSRDSDSESHLLEVCETGTGSV